MACALRPPVKLLLSSALTEDPAAPAVYTYRLQIEGRTSGSDQLCMTVLTAHQVCVLAPVDITDADPYL